MWPWLNSYSPMDNYNIMLSLTVGSDVFNLTTIGGIGGFHLHDWVVYRVWVYISLMTSGEFVRLYSLSVGLHLWGASKGIFCTVYFGPYFRISRIIDFLDSYYYSYYYLNLIYINYCWFWMCCFWYAIMSIIRYIV